jgi:iron complex outermembrane recepter protein
MVQMRVLAGSAAACLIATAAFAQQQGSGVEQVVVTAKTLPMDQVAGLDKTGTPLADVPRSIEVIPRELLNQQGATQLSQALPNVSGASQGGQYNFGFFDRFIIRGLNATFLNDGMPEGTSDLTGFVHTLLGVERVEVLKGPGSAMYGDAEEGGTINLVHYRPSDVFGATLSEQYGSFGTTTTDVALTGPTGVDGIDARIDGEYQHSDGFRDLANQTGAVSAAFSFHPEHHDIRLRVEYDNLEDVPDAEGIPFTSSGALLEVPNTNKYYTPFAFANQQIERVYLTDAWTVDDSLVVNLRTAYNARDVDLARNSGGSVALVGGLEALTKRQLREQQDNVGDFTFQAEPTWTFDTGSLKHVLVTGFEDRDVNAGTVRATADLPNIANVFDPVINDGSIASLTFKCDAAHSCDNAKLLGEFYGLYAIDQIDVTDALKLRLSVRQDWFDTEAAARTAGIPANPGQEEPCSPPAATECALVPGAPAKRSDSRVSWDEGAVYFLTPSLSVFGGFSSAAYPIFNTEEPESVGHVPETGTQVEAGLRFERSWVTASSSLYRVTRDNVFTVFADTSGQDVPTVFSYRVEGWETDVDLQPLPNWTVLANFSIQSPVITSYPSAPADVGNPVPSVPQLLANLYTTYAIPVSILGENPIVSFGERVHSHEYGAVTDMRRIPGAALSDIALTLPFQTWKLQAGISNLFDRANFVDAAGTGGGAMPGFDRTYFVKLTYQPT